MKTYIPKNLQRWKLPDCYYGTQWPGYYVFLAQHRDCDCLSRSNFRCGMEALKKLPAWEGKPEDDDNNVSRYVVRENHWAVGWVEWIAIHESDHEALKTADEMAGALEEYPVLDESDFSELEEEEAQYVWLNCYNVRDRVDYVRKHRSQFEFHSWQDLLGCIKGRYFGGYASELLV